MRKTIFLMPRVAAFSLWAEQTNSILFVTQIPNPGSFTSITSTFGNHLNTPVSCDRESDFDVCYPDGAIENVTRGGDAATSVDGHPAQLLRVNVTQR